MFEVFAELIQRFFTIKSVYVKAAIALFIMAVLINSGLLLFIPGMHTLQYPTISLLFTILAYVTGLCIAIIFATFEKGHIQIHPSTLMLVISCSFVMSIFYACVAINLYNSVLTLAEYFLTCLQSLSITTGCFVFGAFIVYHWKIKNSYK